MIGQTTRTVAWGALAAVLSLAAAYYYPWPQVERQQSQVNQPLFEDFEDKKVGFIELEQFNDDLQTLERINLQRRGDRYLIPGFDNFNADNIGQISNAIGSLRKTVLQVISDKVEDHTRFGVVDPQEFQSTSNKSFLGKKITLQDANRGLIGSLIVGLAPDDVAKKDQRYVRIEGQPNVYLVQFDERILTTRFADWVDKNLMRLDPQVNSPEKIVIDNYRISPDKILENLIPKTQLYRATFEAGPRSFPLRVLEVEKNKEWLKVTPDQSQISSLEKGLIDLTALPLVKAKRLDKELTAAFRLPHESSKVDLLNSLSKFGFRCDDLSPRPMDLLATGGRIDVFTNGNIRISMLLGNFESTNLTRSKLCRWVLIFAEPDLSKFTRPTPPEQAEGKELTDEQKAEFARAERAVEQNIAKARQMADNLNAIHASWLYSVDEESITKLRPEISVPKDVRDQPEKPAPTDQEAPTKNL